MASLRGKVAVVMGAGSGGPGWSNGKAVAVSYAREGASVVCVDLRHGNAEDTRATIEREGGRAIAVTADATREEEVRAAVGAAVEAFGAVDVLHNNVGASGVDGEPTQVAPEAWDRELAVTLRSAYLGIRCAVPEMRKRGGGVIINTSSLFAVRWVRRPNTAYTAAKAAVEALTRSCAYAYGRDGIRVNCIRIGFSETPAVMAMLDRFSDDERDRALAATRSMVPLRGQHGEAWDVAAAAVFLAGDGAKHITGAILGVDGGLECAPL